MNVNGKFIRYRYPRAKAKYLASAMTYLREKSIDVSSGRAMRDSLLPIPGVGPKTAGWVARNYLDADDVAILDIHLIRAGLLCDLFNPNQRIERDYGWALTFDGRGVSVAPSVGNWNLKCRSHYVISGNRIEWAGGWTTEQIAAGFARDQAAKARYYGQSEAVSPAANVPAQERPRRSRWSKVLDFFFR
jgi:hypothetical protein